MAELTISSRRRRIFAFMIDHIVFCCMASMGSFFLMGENWDVGDSMQMLSAILPFMLVLFLLYFMKDSIKGMSPGRFFLSIAVRDQTSIVETPSFLRLVIRNLLLIIWPVEFLVLVSGEKSMNDSSKSIDISARGLSSTFCGVFVFMHTWGSCIIAD